MLTLLPMPMPYSAAKFQKTSALLEVAELRSLFNTLESEVGKLYFYHIGAVLEESLLQGSIESIVELYGESLVALKNNEKIKPLSIAMTLDPNTLYMIDAGGGKRIVKFLTPSIHITSTAICYLPELQEFKEKLYGSDLISWGLQFSYPQLFQEHKSQLVQNPLQEGVNAKLFKLQQRWLREHTKPTFFLTEKGQIKTAIRLGKECYSWINSHPKLQKAHIHIDL